MAVQIWENSYRETNGRLATQRDIAALPAVGACASTFGAAINLFDHYSEFLFTRAAAMYRQYAELKRATGVSRATAVSRSYSLAIAPDLTSHPQDAPAPVASESFPDNPTPQMLAAAIVLVRLSTEER